jgi:TrpR family trp operon transcriptional repressor
MNTFNKKYKTELTTLLTSIPSSEAMDKFLDDLLTPAEYEEIAKRWQIVKLLQAGVPQREIAKQLNVGIATVTRGSRMLQQSSSGLIKAAH